MLREMIDELSYNPDVQVSLNTKMDEIHQRLDDLEERRSLRSRSRCCALSSVKEPSSSSNAPPEFAKFSFPSTSAPRKTPTASDADLLKKTLQKSRSERHAKGKLPIDDTADPYKDVYNVERKYKAEMIIIHPPLYGCYIRFQ